MDKPDVVKSQSLTIAKIHQVVPAGQIRTVMGPTLAELKRGIGTQGRTITGPWFTHHLQPPARTFDFEVCFPISGPVEPQGRMQPDAWPEMTVVRTVYRGGYEGLPAAWAEFTRWADEHGHDVAVDLWERYLVGPESAADPSEWRTELNRPLVIR